MIGVVGQPARGDNFYPRPEIISIIYRRLETSHIYISAPRRVGKTSIMRYLQDNPKDTFEFKYVITQATSNPTNFYKALLKEIRSFQSLSQNSLDSISGFLEKITGLQLFGTGIQIEKDEKDIFESCKSILKNLNTNGKNLVIMIDEFAQTVENIWKERSENEARKFLYANREIQEEANPNIKFIYTGSLGLHPLCARLNALDALSKLNVVEVGPLSFPNALILCEKILDSARVEFNADALSHLLTGIHWLIPFHIQLALQELIDLSLINSCPINIEMVDKALIDITNRKSSHYFEHYHNHLKKGFEGNGKKYEFVKSLLIQLAQNNHLQKDEIILLANEFGENSSVNNIIEILEYDGYIFGDYTQTPTVFRFTSPILMLWWKRNMS